GRRGRRRGVVIAPVVELRGVSRVFPAGDVSVTALVDADLVVEPGDYVAVVGPSGSGKSTMLNILSLLDRPTSGTYLLEGIDTSTLSEGQQIGRASCRERVKMSGVAEPLGG